ncbi:MAG: bifunctional diguanylate cyclase/phosphodiesterase [Actinobacteria bacterium]|nr:bifunctional diguanylate cyclase/phosphodiesterase [Actinomycetota bacterium]
MPTTQTNAVNDRWLNAYVAMVAIVAVAMTTVVFAMEACLVAPGKLTYVCIFAALLVIGETRNAWFRFGDGGEVTPGWAFAFSIVLLGSPFIAIAAMAACTLFVDLRDRKAANRVVFNVGQITASLAAGATVLQLFGLKEPLTDAGTPSSGFALAILIGGGLVFTLNGVLTCIVMAIHYKTSVRSMMGRSFFLSISADGALLALSPIFVVALTFSLYMLPLLGVTALLIYQSTQQALKRAHEADHDSLTGLLNRRAFDQHLAGFLDSNRDVERQGGLLLLDLDGFKEINDRLGHQTGDSVLKGIANQLTRSASEAAMIARLGGDEFAVLIPAVESDTAMMQAAERLCNELAQPIAVDGFPLSVGVSMGLALIPRHGRTAEEALGAADIAMYRAKRYRTGVEMYRTIGSRAEKGRLGLLGELSQAQATGQLQVHYQPLTRFLDGAPVGMEALLRWQHPTLGTIPPTDFITLAEHTDLIGPLTQYVLDRATTDARDVEKFDVRLSINVSARNLQDRRFPSGVFRALDAAGVDPSRLELEITESAIAREPERSLFAITGLREAGIRVAIDDFGTGYSSFALLRDFPVDRLKIDSTFVDGIAQSLRQQHLVRAIVGLAKGLGVDVVAEGVETEESWLTLAELGCDVAQGFLICRPVPLPDLVEWLEIRRSMAELEQGVAS